jgi:hypothetical protein
MTEPRYAFTLNDDGEYVPSEPTKKIKESKKKLKESGSALPAIESFDALQLEATQLELIAAKVNQRLDSKEIARQLALSGEMYTGKRGPRTTQMLVGKRFGRLVVQAPNHHYRGKGLYWRCQCDCGNTHVVLTHHLTSGKTKSCGCMREQIIAGVSPETHKQIKTFFRALTDKNSK